jgi:ATP-dependent RNA helicase RhlE
MRFEELRLAEPIVRAVASQGYTTPTPIQMKAIPEVMAGNDLLGCAETGSGKTGAFALPILHRLSLDRARRTISPRTRSRRRLRALVVCPTRELASQIAESFRVYGRNLPLRHAAVFGGVSQHPQVRALEAGVDVLIATPGRLLDLINQGFVDLSSIEVLVLDEADRMLDMGFIPDIRRIVRHLPPRRQTLLFSATMPADIRRLADSILRNPVNAQVNPVASTVQTVSQSLYHVSRKDKPALLQHLLRRGNMIRTLVFTRTKHGADKVVKGLLRAGIRAQAIHSNKSQNARTRALNGFRSGTPAVLVATDIASRGIDVDEITHVINFDVPNVPETYVHRVGRTARAGAPGFAVSFCDQDEWGHLSAIERLIRMRIEVNADLPDLNCELSDPQRSTERCLTPRAVRGAHRRPNARSNGRDASAARSRRAATRPKEQASRRSFTPR